MAKFRRTRPATTLSISYDKLDEFDRALYAEAKPRHRSQCLFGLKGKVAAAESPDPQWLDPHLAVMPERPAINYTYGDMRFSHPLTAEDVAWIDAFDAGENVRSRSHTITLDPNLDTPLYRRGATTGSHEHNRPGQPISQNGCRRSQRARLLANTRIAKTTK